MSLARVEAETVTAACLCQDCGVPVEPQVLTVDPAVRLCLECLSPEDRRELEDDLEKAGRVQRRLLPPTHLEQDGWEVAWLWEPKNGVSGDHVDLLAPAGPGAPLHLLLGDVVGKGVAASLLQTHLHALFRAAAPGAPGPSVLLDRVNAQFAQVTGAASYATFLAMSAHGDGTVELANAGHPRPLLADRRGVRPVEGADVPLGLFHDSTYGSHRLNMEPGDTLLLYTDGLTEAEAPVAEGEDDPEQYGIGRASAALRRAGAGAQAPSLAELLARCRADMEAFLAGAPRADDLTLLALRRTA